METVDDYMTVLGEQYEYLNCDMDIEIAKQITNVLAKAGVMYRLFGRTKTLQSCIEKLNKKGEKYVLENKKMQDLVGIRIVLYYKDDINAVIRILDDKYKLVNKTMDTPNPSTFEPQRINCVYEIPENMSRMVGDMFYNNCLIDKTFEVQIRTIFSEGWHEVEHDIRYKFKDTWKTEIDNGRRLNSVLATLEICDLELMSITEDLAYNAYKRKDWESMIRNHFRLRFTHDSLTDSLVKIIDYKEDLGKSIFRYNRDELIWLFYRTRLPLKCDNVVYIINKDKINDERILAITPNPVASRLEELNS